jgi:hypothetical protein
MGKERVDERKVREFFLEINVRELKMKNNKEHALKENVNFKSIWHCAHETLNINTKIALLCRGKKDTNIVLMRHQSWQIRKDFGKQCAQESKIFRGR